MPYSVPLNVQLLTSRSCTPRTSPTIWVWMRLPIDTPWPVPKVQLDTVMFAAAAALPPISMLSSPSLIEQFRMSTLVEARSIPSVLGESKGVLIVTSWIVRFWLLPFSIRWNVGGFCSVTFWISVFLQPLKLMKFGRDEALGNHQFVPCPSMAPGPLISTSWSLAPLMKGRSE